MRHTCFTKLYASVPATNLRVAHQVRLDNLHILGPHRQNPLYGMATTKKYLGNDATNWNSLKLTQSPLNLATKQ